MVQWPPWMSDVLLKSFSLSFMLVGLLGLVVPVIPGLVIIWVVSLGYGLIAGFGTLGWAMFALITVLMIAGSVVDNILMGKKAHETGAPWWSVAIALIAGVAGSFALPVIGGILAAMLALFLVEYARRKNAKDALLAMRGIFVGCGWAFVIRFIMGMFMIGFWLIWAFV